MATVDISYLLNYLRLYIGDTTPATYRYTDAWLKTALEAAVKFLAAWWNNKYIIDTNYLVSRNTEVTSFLDDEPPVIQADDEWPLVLAAAIITLEGSLESTSWNIASWKDYEISYSNLESGKLKDRRIERMLTDLKDYLLPPTKRLARPIKQSLPGYLNNSYERDGKY
jgi:hypothetical protein